MHRKRYGLTWLPKVKRKGGEDGYKYTEVSPSLGYNISFAQGLFLMPHFDYHFRYALITYSQCGDLSPDRVGDLFQSLGAQLVIGRENHADGGIHLHCFVDFGRKRRFRRATVFDVEGRHPNIEKSRGTPEGGYDYAIKDGDIVFKSLDRPIQSGVGNSKTHEKWTEITSASDRESFWDLVHQLDPKSAATHFSTLQKYCDWKFAVKPASYESPGNISFVGGEIDGRADWLQQSCIGTGDAPIGMLSNGRSVPKLVCVSAMPLGPASRPGPASCQSSH